MDDLSLLVAAGGTGGHIYPGLAVADEVRRQVPAARIVFVGTSRGLEGRLVPAAGYPIELVRVEPLRGGSLLRRVRAAASLPVALLDADDLLARVAPAVVMGVGGYLAGPLLAAASLRGISTLLLEPNVEPGLANRLLAPLVDAAAVAWEETLDWYGSRGFVTGNPVRGDIAATRARPGQGDGPTRVLLVGGSQGSRPLNRALTAALPLLAAGLEITHQTGPADEERVRTAYGEHGVAGEVVAYVDDMAAAYAGADVVIARAGATTCAELAAVGLPSVLVPLPLAGDHQRHNAEALARAGAAVVIPQDELTPERLAATLAGLAADRDRLARMGAAAGSLARRGAARAIATRLRNMARRNGA